MNKQTHTQKCFKNCKVTPVRQHLFVSSDCGTRLKLLTMSPAPLPQLLNLVPKVLLYLQVLAGPQNFPAYVHDLFSQEEEDLKGANAKKGRETVTYLQTKEVGIRP